MLESGERTIGQLSQELGVSSWSLKRWSKVHSGKDKAATGGSLSAMELENAKLRRELKTVSRQRDISKKRLRHLGPGTAQLYEVIRKMGQDANYSRRELCATLGVSRSGWYNHLQKPKPGGDLEDEVLAQRIVEFFTHRTLRLMNKRHLRPMQKCRGRA